MSARIESPDEIARMRTMLDCVADALGVPIETFTSPDADMTEELLNLWYAMPSAACRQHFLDTMREIAMRNRLET